jgi:hypothetical protein
MKILIQIFLALLCVSAFAQTKTTAQKQKPEVQYTESFDQENCHFTTSSIHTYFFLRPGYQSVFREVEGKDTTEVTITVLKDTKAIGTTETRVIEERESVNGKLREVSKNYVAVCRESGSIFYFGEDVDNYKGDSIVSHSGSWLAEGKNKPGVMMPGTPLLGGRYYQEMAPGVAMDRAEIISMSDTVETPAGTFGNVLKILETTPLEPKDKSYKYYAPRIGLIKDGNLVLVKYGVIH